MTSITTEKKNPITTHIEYNCLWLLLFCKFIWPVYQRYETKSSGMGNVLEIHKMLSLQTHT